MNLSIVGDGRLADVVKRAAELRGATTQGFPDLVILAVDVDDHDNLTAVHQGMEQCVSYPAEIPIIVTSQAPPGWTRKWASPRVFCQPHTLISGRELDCAVFPECLVVGCVNPDLGLPPLYKSYLALFNAPIFLVRYETAELSKLAMNYLLASQIGAANKLARVAATVGADWDDIEATLRLDRRIGKHAYIHPGEIGGHLPRDVKTLERMLTT